MARNRGLGAQGRSPTEAAGTHGLEPSPLSPGCVLVRSQPLEQGQDLKSGLDSGHLSRHLPWGLLFGSFSSERGVRPAHYRQCLGFSVLGVPSRFLSAKGRDEGPIRQVKKQRLTQGSRVGVGDGGVGLFCLPWELCPLTPQWGPQRSVQSSESFGVIEVRPRRVERAVQIFRTPAVPGDCRLYLVLEYFYQPLGRPRPVNSSSLFPLSPAPGNR